MLTQSLKNQSPLGKPLSSMSRSDAQTDVKRIASSHVAVLSSKTNGLTKAFVKLAESREAGGALRELQRQEIAAAARVATTAIAIAETQTHKALLAAAMPSVGALATTLVVATQQVESVLTNTAQAGAQAIVANRSATRESLYSCFDGGHLSVEERDALLAQADADHAGDLARLRSRIESTRGVIDGLWRHASQHLASAPEQPSA